MDRPVRTARIIQSVLGPIDAAELGITSIHEHLLLRVDGVAYRPVDSDEGRAMGERRVCLENLWFVRQNWTNVRDNLRLDDEPTATRELARFAAAGGRTIVDTTTDGLGRDPQPSSGSPSRPA